MSRGFARRTARAISASALTTAWLACAGIAGISRAAAAADVATVVPRGEYSPFARGPAPSFLPPLAVPPLAGPLVVTDDFGERRGNHFHAALDFSTGGSVGRPVRAPESGYIERVRASGVGYGRSLYLHADNGLLLVFGHLDAFDGPVAAFVDSAQRASAEYEQDLWPWPGRFRVRAGDRVAWSGESGAGPPHLHLEVRIGDMAMNPLRAGVPVIDSTPPRITRMWVDPVGVGSWVEGRATPYEWTPGRSDTVHVVGRARVRVLAEDAISKEHGGLACYAVAAEWNGGIVECRFDSVSWATDMDQVDQVYQGDDMRLWSSGFRPRVIAVRGGQPWLEVAPGAAPRPLRITARDVSGNVAEKVLWLAPARVPGPDTLGVPAAQAHVAIEVAAAGPGCLRVVARGVPRGSRDVRIEIAPVGEAVRAAAGHEGWSAIVAVARAAPAVVLVRGVAGRKPWSAERALRVAPGTAGPGEMPESEAARRGATDLVLGRWKVESGAWCEPAVLTLDTTRVSATHELEPVGPGLELGAGSPLRTVWRVTCAKVPARSHLGLYHDEGGGWEWMRTFSDPRGATSSAETRRLGRFALMIDHRAPRIAHAHAPRTVARDAAYSRWALEAKVTEEGSGVDLGASRFEVDGAPVATEWDVDQHVLRWRPRVPPARGAHHWRAIAVDHAGNRAEAHGRFVIN